MCVDGYTAGVTTVMSGLGAGSTSFTGAPPGLDAVLVPVPPLLPPPVGDLRVPAISASLVFLLLWSAA